MSNDTQRKCPTCGRVRKPAVPPNYAITRRQPDEGFRIAWTVATLGGEFLGTVQLSVTDLAGYWWVYVGQRDIPHEQQSAEGKFYQRRRDAIKHLVKRSAQGVARG